MMSRIKVIALLCYALLISTTVFSQKRGFQVLHEEKIVGKYSGSEFEITGSEFTFPEIIHEVFLDPETNFATVQLKGRRNSGRILQYDIENKEILWSKKIDYGINELLKFDNLLILNDYNEAYVIDPHTGENLSKILSYIYLANPEHNIGMAYLYIASGDGYYTNDFMGMDLLNGKLAWKRSIDRSYGWNDFFYLNDSTLLVMATGLHTINIKTGTGWSYNTITGQKLYSASSGSSHTAYMMGALFGLIGGLVYYAVSSLMGGAAIATGGDVIRDISSNALVESAFIYHASREQIVKLNKETGKIIWRHTLPIDMISKSSIFTDDRMVYLVNYGYAFKGSQQLKYGKPFIAAFYKKTGEVKYLSTIRSANDPILGYQEIDNELFLLFPNAIVKYNLTDGVLIFEKALPQNYSGKLKSFANNDVLVANKNSYFISPYQSHSTDLHITTHQGGIISFDDEINITRTADYKDIGTRFLRYNDNDIIRSLGKTFIINKEGKIIAELNVSSNAFLIDGVLFDKREKSFVAIDLKNVMN
jgi:outer membrane protein assembly factor BamB